MPCSGGQRCWASLFGARTIFYREKRGCRRPTWTSPSWCRGRSVDARGGHVHDRPGDRRRRDRLVIEGAFGLGETVVSGQVSPDHYVVDKATHRSSRGRLAQGADIERRRRRNSTRELDRRGRAAGADRRRGRALAELARRIEPHYGAPQDTEWAVDADGTSGCCIAADHRPPATHPAAAGELLLHGLGAAPGMASGPVRARLARRAAEAAARARCSWTQMTAPDWVPLMRRAAAIVTDSGGMTSHAAIVSRELGIPCVVGTRTGHPTLRDGELVTVDAGRGSSSGPPAAPPSPRRPRRRPAPPAPVTATRSCSSTSPSLRRRARRGARRRRRRAASRRDDGARGARGRHPRLLLEQGRGEEFVERMAEALDTFAAGFAPRPIIYRTIDFRTNEFRGLEAASGSSREEATR